MILPDFCYSGRKLKEVNGIVIHYFSAINANPEMWDDVETCLDLFIDLNSPGPERGLVMNPDNTPRFYASAHYLIDRGGQIYSLVDESLEAYHAGKSEWKGRSNLNSWTLGIEFIATHDSGFTDEQYLAGQQLVAQLISKYAIPLDNIVGHSDVAPGRKKDPGPMFDFERFKQPLQYVV